MLSQISKEDVDNRFEKHHYLGDKLKKDDETIEELAPPSAELYHIEEREGEVFVEYFENQLREIMPKSGMIEFYPQGVVE